MTNALTREIAQQRGHVAEADHSDRLVVVEHQEVSVLVGMEDIEAIVDVVGGVARVNGAGHHFADPRGIGVFARIDNPAEQVSLREDADDFPILLDDQTSDVRLGHLADGLANG